MVNWRKYQRNVLEHEIRRAFGQGLGMLVEADENPAIRKKCLIEAKSIIAYIQVRLEEAKLDNVISVGFWEELSYALSTLRFSIDDYIVERFSKRSNAKK